MFSLPEIAVFVFKVMRVLGGTADPVGQIIYASTLFYFNCHVVHDNVHVLKLN